MARGRVVAEGVEAGSSASLDGEVAGEASFKQLMYCSTLRKIIFPALGEHTGVQC